MDLTKLSNVNKDVEPQVYRNKYEPAKYDDNPDEQAAQPYVYLFTALLCGVAALAFYLVGVLQ